ncbi:hypothetical protein H5410_044988 [Solanum commersonii]|uniref:Uncharacterized protein n=1 Tax=Solanum commersonii TaxID=4109 RepID=A0A9J5X9R3_SOLCO|nr:hypothetical protein H5410_044988 [Solanum commersonii]
MVVSSTNDFQVTVKKGCDKMGELKTFDDAGIDKVPQIFILPQKKRLESSDTRGNTVHFPIDRP